MPFEAWSRLELSSGLRRGHQPIRRWARQTNVVPRQLRTLDVLPMLQRISAEVGQGWETGESGGTSARPEHLTGCYCIARIAAHHGLELSVEQLRHAYPL